MLATRYMCDTCGAIRRHIKDAYMHTDICSGSPILSCSNCDEIFLTTTALENHYDRTHKVRVIRSRFFAKFDHECRFCGMGFDKPALLYAHVKIHLRSCGKAKCDMCNASFTDQGHLTTHKLVHRIPRTYQCEQCVGISFHCSNNLDYHQAEIH